MAKKRKLRKGTYIGKDTAAARKATAELNAKGMEMAKQSDKEKLKAYYMIQEIRKLRAMGLLDE